jgi:hypothetical protein
MTALLRPAFSASALLLAVSLTVPACASSGSSSSGGANTSDYCSQASDYVARCHITDACTLAQIQDCSTTASNFSAATLAAEAACFSAASCGDGGTTTLANCPQPAPGAPTAAQTKLAEDYCAVCHGLNQTAADCVAGFYRSGPNEAGLPTLPGPGSSAIRLSDSFATNVDAECIPKLVPEAGALACTLAFDQCLLQTLTAVLKQPAACSLIPGIDAGTDAAEGG